MLQATFSPGFSRDLKRLKKRHVDSKPLSKTISLVLANTKETKEVLRQHHKMHVLKGEWDKCYECHVANCGDWLLIWIANDKKAVFLRTGTHDELFKK